MTAIDETIDEVELTLRLPAPVASRLKDIAKVTERSESEVIAAAMDSYVYLDAEQIKEVEQAIREADAGDFASDEEVRAFFAQYGVNS